MFREIRVDDDINRDPSLASAVDQATKQLLKTVGPTSSEVTATWTLAYDARKRPILCLNLAHPRTSVEARLYPTELADEDRRYWRLSQLWDDLLQQLSHEYLKQLKQTVEQLEGD